MVIRTMINQIALLLIVEKQKYAPEGFDVDFKEVLTFYLNVV